MEVSDVFGQLVSPKTLVTTAWVRAALRKGGRGLPTAIGTSLAVLAADGLKRIVVRRRPRLDTEDPLSSFPSGHSAASTGYLFGLAFDAAPAWRGMALVAAAVGALGVSVTRIRARQHWPSDALAGGALGLLTMAITQATWIAMSRRPARAVAPVR